MVPGMYSSSVGDLNSTSDWGLALEALWHHVTGWSVSFVSASWRAGNFILSPCQLWMQVYWAAGRSCCVGSPRGRHVEPNGF